MSIIRLTLLALVACVPLLAQAAPYQLTTAWPVNVGPLNPHLYTPNQMFAQSMVYEPLVKYQADGSVQPWLATRWRHSADGKTWWFTLRDDVAFSNGEPFNAQAAAANFQAVLANRQRHAWLELANQITDVRALSATELQITLKSAYAPLLQELALPRPFRFIAPSQFIDGGTARGIKAPIGTGPWRLASSQLNQRDVLVRNERYWGRKPALQQITIKVIPDATSRAVAFETGEIDMLYGDEGLLPLDTFERFRHHPGYVARLSAPAETVMLALNASQGPTREQAVREALNYAVDKQTLVDSVLYGTQQVADTLFAPSVPYAPQDLTPRRYDPTKARALLEQGIDPINVQGLRVTVTSDESRMINTDRTPKVILSASGMCEAGRIRHHLKHNLWRPECTILFVGYQAVGTLGRTLIEGATTVKLFGEPIEVQAEICQLTGMSGHADRDGLLRWVNAFTEKPKRVFVMHGEDEVENIFVDTLTGQGFTACAPYNGAQWAIGAEGAVCLQEGTKVRIEHKVSEGQNRAATVFQRLVSAGKRLLRVIEHNEGGANKDLAKFADQINALCDKWDN